MRLLIFGLSWEVVECAAQIADVARWPVHSGCAYDTTKRVWEGLYDDKADVSPVTIFTPWLEGQVRPKDAYFAVKTVIQTLDQSTYKGRIETPARTWCLHFERCDEAMFALWCLDDAMTMTLKDASPIKSVASMVGTPVFVKDSLTVSGRPLYVRCAVTDAERLKQQIREANWIKGG